MGKIIIHTLAFNLPSEVRIATKQLYEKNKDCEFVHIIVDLGFPLEMGADVPVDIDQAKRNNTEQLKAIAAKYGSTYIQFKNEGVSQNWTSVMRAISLEDDDVLICADPDERPMENGWVKAVATVLRSEHKIAWCSLSMPYARVKDSMDAGNYNLVNIGGYETYIMKGQFNWPQGGFNGAFLNKIGGIPVPKGASIYGWLEHACFPLMAQHGYAWAIVRDYEVDHTECSPLYREWKTEVTSMVHKGQMQFEDWLRTKSK
jgi:hypothetical protein